MDRFLWKLYCTQVWALIRAAQDSDLDSIYYAGNVPMQGVSVRRSRSN
jgi:hypothetical protein